MIGRWLGCIRAQRSSVQCAAEFRRRHHPNHALAFPWLPSDGDPLVGQQRLTGDAASLTHTHHLALPCLACLQMGTPWSDGTPGIASVGGVVDEVGGGEPLPYQHGIINKPWGDAGPAIQGQTAAYCLRLEDAACQEPRLALSPGDPGL